MLRCLKTNWQALIYYVFFIFFTKFLFYKMLTLLAPSNFTIRKFGHLVNLCFSYLSTVCLVALLSGKRVNVLCL